MAWPGTGSMVVLLFAPLAAAQVFWVRSLWPKSQRRRTLLVAASVLGLVPAAAGVLLVFQTVTGLLAPVGAPAGLVVLVGLVGLGVGAAWLLDRFVPRERAEWMLAPLLALPLLVVVVTLLGLEVEPDGLYATLLGLSALLLGALAPWLVAHWNARGARWDKTNAIALVVLLVPSALGSGVILLIGVSAGEATPADYTWQVTVEPENELAEWTVEVPFFVTSPRAVSQAGIVPISHAMDVRETLRERVESTSGRAELTWLDDGARLRIEGQGSVTVGSSYAFWGSSEAFNVWRLDDTDVFSAPASTGNVTVAWRMNLDGSSCFADADHELELAPGTSKPLEDDAEDGANRPGLAHPWQIACT